jgi:hypothetical protein
MRRPALVPGGEDRLLLGFLDDVEAVYRPE